MKNSITDVPGIKVGHYTDREAATGCTVLLLESCVSAGVDVRGSAPGTRETDLLRPMSLVQGIHALLISGGSAFGLNAAAGVVRYLEEKGIGFDTPSGKVPIVSAAVIFDLDNGNPQVRPGPDDAYRACMEATDSAVAEGSVGAGTGATVGKVLGIKQATKSGLGAASQKISSDITVGALAVVNALGDIIDPETGTILAGTRRPDGKGFAGSVELIKKGADWMGGEITNTSIGVVATSAYLNKEQVNKVAQMAHDGMARAINPCHTMFDGDTIFSLSMSEQKGDINAIGSAAAEVMATAITRAVKAAESLAGIPSRSSLL